MTEEKKELTKDLLALSFKGKREQKSSGVLQVMNRNAVLI